MWAARVDRIKNVEAWAIRDPLTLFADSGGGLLADIDRAGADVDTVLRTGSTALIPAACGLFEARFGATRLRSGDVLASVASGLARHFARLG